jgi:biopolymer transport protein ExbD
MKKVLLSLLVFFMITKINAQDTPKKKEKEKTSQTKKSDSTKNQERGINENGISVKTKPNKDKVSQSSEAVTEEKKETQKPHKKD